MSLHSLLWSLRRTLRLSPTQRVFRALADRGVRTQDLDALDVFAHNGFFQTRDFHPRVRSLEAWEVDPRMEADLRRNLPGAKIKITDSFQEIRSTPATYGLVVLDPPSTDFGAQHQYHEQFDIFPEVFRVLRDDAVVVLNLIPGGTPETAPGGRFAFSEKRLARRAAFYSTDHPERLTVEEMLPAHRALAEANGFTLAWHVAAPRTRNKRLWHLVLGLKRQPAH